MEPNRLYSLVGVSTNLGQHMVRAGSSFKFVINSHCGFPRGLHYCTVLLSAASLRFIAEKVASGVLKSGQGPLQLWN
jgi:hypothetical protein